MISLVMDRLTHTWGRWIVCVRKTEQESGHNNRIGHDRLVSFRNKTCFFAVLVQQAWRQLPYQVNPFLFAEVALVDHVDVKTCF